LGIALSIIFLGQAITSYEIFTGKTLPHRGVFRNWKVLLITGFIYSFTTGWLITFLPSALYVAIITVTLIAISYSWFNYRGYQEREIYINTMRNLLSRDNMKNPESSNEIYQAFSTLVEEILEAENAALVPGERLAAIIEEKLVFPANLNPDWQFMSLVSEKNNDFKNQLISLEKGELPPFYLALPLWGNSGSSGYLMLGNKKNNGVYSQEEIELARTISERLLDTQANFRITECLREIQTQKMTESQLMDRKSRRILHDDILPQIHTIMLELNTSSENRETISQLSLIHRKISDLLREMPPASSIEMIRGGIYKSLKWMINEELKDNFDEVIWELANYQEQEWENLSPTVSEVLFYASREIIRNSARYGRSLNKHNPLILTITFNQSPIKELIISDNGAGFREPIKKEKNGGSGQGLIIHSTMMFVIGGKLLLENSSSSGTRIHLQLPQS